MKQRLAHRVGEFYDGEIKKNFRTVEVQAGSGRITKKCLLGKKKLSQTRTTIAIKKMKNNECVNDFLEIVKFERFFLIKSCIFYNLINYFALLNS